MKARIERKLTADEKELARLVRQQIEDDIQKEQNKAILRTVKMTCVILNDTFGFGHKRLMQFFNEITDRGKNASDNPEGWFRVDERLHQLGMNFQDEDIEERERHIRALYHEKGRKYRE
jgi:hypothetical protein